MIFQLINHSNKRFYSISDRRIPHHLNKFDFHYPYRRLAKETMAWQFPHKMITVPLLVQYCVDSGFT